MDYRSIADRLAGDIATGRLPPGHRLPPQRDFAYREKIAVSTAGRVYAELTRRGLVAGEVGRGTFVRHPVRVAVEAHPAYGVADPPREMVDFERNFPILPDQGEELGAILRGICTEPAALATALTQTGPAATAALRGAMARHLAWSGWQAPADRLLFAGNGRQGVAAVFAALVPPGGRIGFEALTYPVARATAARLGFVPVPIPMDEHGLIPEALDTIHRAEQLSAVYLQPTLHNPLGMTMPEGRRRDVAALLQRHGITAAEDLVYGFLASGAPPPLASFAPDRVVLVDSLSKRIAPGVAVGAMVVPPGLRSRIAAALRGGGWSANNLCLTVAQHYLEAGLLPGLESRKRADAAARQRLARQALEGLSLRADAEAYHLWLDLPEHWRAELFVAAAARRGIAVSPGAAFAVSAAHAPPAVRVALAAPPLVAVGPALEALAELARGRAEIPGLE
jgi:DNA-binding transcriptional MocR family regulator